MCFDVPKVVRSPRYGHRHDEESRNGPDIKIDILDGYVWTSEGFRVSLDEYRSTGGLPEPPGECNGPHGPWWREEGAARAGRAPPPPLVRIGQGGGAAPPFPSSLPPPSPLLLIQQGREGVLLPVGVGFLLARPSPGRPPLPPCSFIYGGRGHPRTHKLIC